jgi:hypothetical protein
MRRSFEVLLFAFLGIPLLRQQLARFRREADMK